MKVTKAVIPAAGLGTRMLPISKSVPKEMLPIVDKPAIQYLVEEAVASGITDILIVTGRNKEAIENHFDHSLEYYERLEKSGKTKQLEELKAIAVMRLVHPKNLIPASLDVEGVAGLKTRLAAGANVITSIIPPRKGLAGVAQHELDIDDGGRSVEQIEAILDDINVKIADKYEYINLIESWKNSKKAGVSL